MGARFSALVQTGPGAHPTSCTMGTGSFPGGKERPGREADPSPLLVPWSGKNGAIPRYSPCGPYGLYRASVPVKGYTLPYTPCISGFFNSTTCFGRPDQPISGRAWIYKRG